jgi:hypothetical protein
LRFSASRSKNYKENNVQLSASEQIARDRAISYAVTERMVDIEKKYGKPKPSELTELVVLRDAVRAAVLCSGLGLSDVALQHLKKALADTPCRAPRVGDVYVNLAGTELRFLGNLGNWLYFEDNAGGTVSVRNLSEAPGLRLLRPVVWTFAFGVLA